MDTVDSIYALRFLSILSFLSLSIPDCQPEGIQWYLLYLFIIFILLFSMSVIVGVLHGKKEKKRRKLFILIYAVSVDWKCCFGIFNYW